MENKQNLLQTDNGLLYQVEEKPRNLKDGVVFGFQHILTMFGGMTIPPLALSAALGMSATQTAQLLCLCMIGSGLATLCQTTFGVKLPVIQTMSLAFLSGYIAIANIITSENGGVPDISMTMCYIGGAVILGGIVELLLGVTGLISKLKRVFTPIVMGTVMMLIMLSQAEMTVSWASENWLIFLLVATLTFLMSSILPATKWGQRMKYTKYIKALSIVVPVAIGYIVSLILSRTGVFAPGSGAYIDTTVLSEAPWFTVPLGVVNWGMPKFRLDFMVLLLAAYMMSIIESIGQYHANTFACKLEGKLSQKRVGMGIGMEGLGCILSALAGGLSSTSAGENIGLVERTGVASRYIARIGGLWLILAGLTGKFGALISTLSSPIIAGFYVSILGIVGGSGVQTAFTKAKLSSRNVSIFGIALIIGMGFPIYIAANPIDTGILWLNNSINGICSSCMAIGGIGAILLDQILPASDEERGIEPDDPVETTSAEA